MTILTTTGRVEYAANGATVDWPFDFYIPDEDSLVVQIEDADGDILDLSSGLYTATGIDDHDGGSVRYPISGTPLAAGNTLIIKRVVPFTQPTDIVNQSGFYPEVLENALDRLEMQIQQLNDLYFDLPPGPIGPPGLSDYAVYLKDYCSGNGVTNDWFGFMQALALGNTLHARIIGEPGKTYLIQGQVDFPSWVYLDPNGAEFVIEHTAESFAWATGAGDTLFGSDPKTAAYTVAASGTSKGSHLVTLAADPGVSLIGKKVGFATSAFGGRLPYCYRTIVDHVGTLVTLDASLPIGYPATCTMKVYEFYESFVVENGKFELSGIQGDALGFMKPINYAFCKLANNLFYNYSRPGNSDTDFIVLATYGDRFIGEYNRFERCDRNGDAMEFYAFQHASFSGNTISGDGFGLAGQNTEHIESYNNVIHGRNDALGGIPFDYWSPVGAHDPSVFVMVNTDPNDDTFILFAGPIPAQKLDPSEYSVVGQTVTLDTPVGPTDQVVAFNVYSLSVRGEKYVGCGGTVTVPQISGYDTGIKIEDCLAITVNGGMLRSCNSGVLISGQHDDAVDDDGNALFGGHVIDGMKIYDATTQGISGGVINADSDPCTYQNNVVVRIGQTAINGNGNIDIINNTVVDWGLVIPGTAPISVSKQGSVEAKGRMDGNAAYLTDPGTARYGYLIDSLCTSYKIGSNLSPHTTNLYESLPSHPFFDADLEDLRVEGSATLKGAFALTNVITPAIITANVDSYNPPGLADAYEIVLQTDAARDILGLAGGGAGVEKLLTNGGLFNITLKDNDSATPANSFSFSSSGLIDMVLQPGHSIIARYNVSSARWRAKGFAFPSVQSVASITTSGAVTIGGAVTMQAAIFATGVISPAQITSDQTDYAPANFSTASIVHLTSDADRTINSLAGGAAGREVTLFNAGLFKITLADLGAGVAANRFGFSSGGTAPVVLNPAQGITIRYDGGSAVWRSKGYILPAASTSQIWTGTATHVSLTPKNMADALAFGTLTDAATVTVNGAVSGFNWVLTATGAVGATRALGSPTGLITGRMYFLDYRQDGTGSRALTFAAGWDTGGAAPTASTASNARDTLMFLATAGNAARLVGISKGHTT